MKTAVYLRGLDGWRGDARLYKLVPAHVVVDHDDVTVETIEFVVVSAVDPYSDPETYIFPCDEDGKVLSFQEMEGSFRGGLDHTEALRGLGYEPVGPLLC